MKKTIVTLSVLTVLAMAPQAFAFGGGGKKSSGGGSVASFTPSSVVSTTAAVMPAPGPGPVSAPEPTSLLVLGAGLLGASLLRRRK